MARPVEHHSAGESGEDSRDQTARLSAVVITLNEEHNIAECLESLRFCDEIVVLDSGSSDQTVAIARRYTDRVYVEPFEGHVELRRNEAADRASHEWVLMLDADERVSPELAQEIRRRIPDACCVAFRCAIREFMFGGWVDHGGWSSRSYIRLYRRNRVRWSDRIHQKPLVSGQTQELENAILHFSHLTVGHFLRKMDRYTDIEARQRVAAGRKARLGTIPLRFITTVLGRFVYRKGFRDGRRGFLIAFLMAMYYATEEMKTWEAWQRERTVLTGSSEGDAAARSAA